MNNIKKGLILAVGDFPDGNATAMRLLMISRALQSESISIVIGLLHPTIKVAREGEHLVSGITHGIKYVFLNGKTVRPSGMAPAIYDTAKGIFGAISYILRRPVSNRFDFIILYTPSFLEHSLVMLAAFLLRIPLFVEACEVRSQVSGGGKRHLIGRLLNFTEKFMEYMVPKISKGIIPISSGISEYYLNKGAAEEQLYHLPILVDVDLYSKRSSSVVKSISHAKYLLNSGSFAEKDGVKYIVKAFNTVAKKYKDIYLVFTGNVSVNDKESVLRYADSDDCKRRILFVGMLDRDELIWAYQNALALLSCRTNSTYANFGFPTKLGEYLATGTPVIATNVGDVDIFLEHKKTALIAKSEDVADIFSCMQYVIEKAHDSALIGQAGTEVARKFFDYRCYSKTLSKFVLDRLR